MIGQPLNEVYINNLTFFDWLRALNIAQRDGYKRIPMSYNGKEVAFFKKETNGKTKKFK